MDHLTFMADEWRSVTVPVQRLGAGPEYVDRRVLAEHPEVANLVMEKLLTQLQRAVDERGWQNVTAAQVWSEPDDLRDQLVFRATVEAADVWQDGAWTSARAAVEQDQAILRGQGGD